MSAPTDAAQVITMCSPQKKKIGRQIHGNCLDATGKHCGQIVIERLTQSTSYLYSRGVSDNKGPILAIACAAATLRQRRELDVDLVLLIEGEEEAGSRGFAATVRKHKVLPLCICQSQC